MRQWIRAVVARPAVAHLMRAQIRFSRRLGSHFAASITYFTVLAMVPLLASTFSILSLVLTRVLPGVLESLKDAVIAGLGATGGGPRAASIIDASLRSSGSGWTILITVVIAMWTGMSWVGHLRSGIRAQWEPTFDMVHDDREGLLVRKGIDALAFLALLAVLLVAFGTAHAGSAVSGDLGRRLGLAVLPGYAVAIRIGGLVASALASAIFFVFLYSVLPRGRRNWRAIVRGSLAAGVFLALVQTVAGLIVDALDANRTVQAFGSIIIVMLVFNVLAQMVLFLAAWIATADQPAVAHEWNDADEPLRRRGDAWAVEGHWADALADRDARRAEDAPKGDARP